MLHDQCSQAMRLLGCCLLCAASAFQTPSRRARQPIITNAEKSSGGLRLLEWLPSQKVLVSVAKFGWRTVWGIMMAELAPQSPEGAYVRPALKRVLSMPRDSKIETTSSTVMRARGATGRRLGGAAEARAMVRSWSWTTTPPEREGGWVFVAGPYLGAGQKGVYDELGLEGRARPPRPG